VRNYGAAFGVGNSAELPYQGLLLALVSLLALAAIGTYAMRLPAENRLAQTALALIMGGALGNLIDRARLGYVIDFIDVYWATHHWPAFNVADSAITVGVSLLILDIVRRPDEERAAAPQDSPTASATAGEAK
jgi:signal peptidase II